MALEKERRSVSGSDALALIGDYRPGSIQRVKLKNFLTHGNVEFRPGPRLNMVVGANGTGKSTILNAICLGLGGEPKLLGRADDLRAFIMHGKDTTLIEIELTPFEGKEVHVFRRSIDRNKGSEKGRGRGASTFWINGEKANIQAVRDLVGSTYNIQIDNLCTFLPQDKVGNFSGFTDQERLLETEKTLPSNQFFYHRHLELIEMEERMSSQLSNVDSIKDTLKKKRHEFELLEIGKAREEERTRAESQLDLLKKKRIWLEFDQMREQCLELKSQKDRIKEDIRVYREALAPLEEKQQRLESLHKELVAKSKTMDQNCQNATREMQKQVSKFEKHDDDIDYSISKLLELSSKREILETALKDAKIKLQGLEDNLASMPNPEELNQNFAESREAFMRTKREYEGAKREDRSQKAKFSDLEEAAGRLQQKLAKMNDEGARRRENVLRSAPNLGKICEWIDGNKTRFRRPVWGPVAVEISTKSQNAASYLEFHTPNNILKAFVVETREDQNLLYSEIRDKRGIPINIISVQGNQLANTRMYSDAKMRLLKEEYGVEGYLDETFTAPEAVMIALQKYAQVHKVLVGGEKAQHSIDKKKLRDVLSEPDSALGQHGLQQSCIFAVSDKIAYRYSQSVSKYSGKIGARVDQVGAARMLAPGVPEAQKQQVENELQQLHEEISQLRPNVQEAESAAKELESRLQECSLKEKSYKQQLDNLALFQGKVSRQKQKVRDAEAELSSDETKERNDLTKSILNRLVHGIAAVKAHGEQHKLLMKYTAQAAGVHVNVTTVRAAERAAQEALREKQYQYKQLEESARIINQKFNDGKERLRKMKAEAESIAVLQDANGNDTPLKLQLDALDVSNLMEVDAAIEDAERILNQYSANPEVVLHYNKLKDELELLEAQLADCASTQEKGLQLLADQRHDWEKRLEKYILKVNTLFTQYMAEMGCTGEVALKKGPVQEDGQEHKDNFRNWGLEIRVSFREGCKAEVLSAQRHSGGERSVSTILYLMALQDIMVAPFRCVDEINQGLDERNERLVFKRIVMNSCRPPKSTSVDHSGQYFLITPKLLPNLTAMEEEAMTVLFVFNGPFNFKSPTDWDNMLQDARDIEVVNDDEENSDNVVSRRKSKKSRMS